MTNSEHKRIEVDFFCIGAGKSGSTWLAQCLDEHPEITIAKNKEPNFFVRKLSAFGGELNSQYLRDWGWYEDQYAHARPGDRLGDFSVNLMHNVMDAPQIIREHYPDAKLIVILRDPVKRTYSHYWHEKEYDRVPGVPKTFEHGLHNSELLLRSRFGEQLAIWRDVFPKDAFFLIFDFELAVDVDSVFRELLGFLGVDQSFAPPSLHVRVNESTRKSPHLERLYRLAGILRSIGLGRLSDQASRAGLHRALRKLLIRQRRYPPIRPDTAAHLRRELLPDIERLEALFDIDLSKWKESFSP